MDLATAATPLLIPPTPLGTPLTLSISFDLRIPGWLPATYSSSHASTSYFATCHIAIASNASSAPTGSTGISTSSSCAEFVVHRHRVRSYNKNSIPEHGERHYTLRPDVRSASPLECIVSVPDWVDLNAEAKSMRVSVRVRVRKGQGSKASCTHGHGVDIQTMDVDEEEEQALAADDDHDGSRVQSPACSGSDVGPKSDRSKILVSELGMEIQEVERTQ